jgi:hypothetical protein
MPSIYDIYGGSQGTGSDAERASGPPDMNPFVSTNTVLFWVGVLAVLVVMRVAYEALD